MLDSTVLTTLVPGARSLFSTEAVEPAPPFKILTILQLNKGVRGIIEYLKSDTHTQPQEITVMIDCVPLSTRALLDSVMCPVCSSSTSVSTGSKSVYNVLHNKGEHVDLY